MTIREYQRGEHKGGFIGLRVVVNVDRQYRQKYFAYKGATDEKVLAEIRKKAETLNAEWNMERNFAQSKKNLECKEHRRISSAYTTGISGIKMKFVASSKSRSGETTYYTPIFKISGSTDGVRYDGSYNIARLGYDMAWLRAVMYYAEQKSISNYGHLLKRKPPVEQFLVIYKYQNSQGHNIPLRRLPSEIPAELIESMKNM